MSKGLLDPEFEKWRKENLERFGSFNDTQDARSTLNTHDQTVLYPGSGGWKNVLLDQLIAAVIVLGVGGAFVLFFVLMN